MALERRIQEDQDRWGASKRQAENSGRDGDPRTVDCRLAIENAEAPNPSKAVRSLRALVRPKLAEPSKALVMLREISNRYNC